MTNWSYKLYKITEIFYDTIPCYHIDNLPERYNEALLKKTELSLEENKDVMKKLNQNYVDHHCLYFLIYSLTPKRNHICLQQRFLKL